jgi:hypothetical protein
MLQNTFNTDPFLDRAEIQKNYTDSYGLVEQVRSIDLDKVDYSNVEFKPRNRVVETQKVYFWIRVYLNEEVEIKPDTDINITYAESGEKLETKFICYAKKGADKNMDENVINYNPEDNKKVLCLMIDSERINKNSDDIPFIRTLFRIGKYYTPQILRNNDLLITGSDGVRLEFFDIDF